MTLGSRILEARRKAGGALAHGFFAGAARLGRLHPLSKPERHGVEVERDLAYLAESRHAEHRLDIYRPSDMEGPLPTVLYIHGGGFRLLSKETHWLMALSFARRGYLVFNVGYRLAPDHPFPAAIEDVAAAAPLASKTTSAPHPSVDSRIWSARLCWRMLTVSIPS